MRFLITLLLAVPLWMDLQAQQVRVSVTVAGSEGEGGLPMATVRAGKNWLATDGNGFGEFLLSKGSTYPVNVGYVGYHDTSFTFQAVRDTALTIRLRERKFNLTEVQVWDSRLKGAGQALRRSVMRAEVTPADVQARPLIGGEPDILKPLQSVPGVQAGLPGSADLYVRGSDQYQNAIMLDGFQVYNVSHGFGYVSAIPPSVTQKLIFYKEGYPVEFGNGASSFINAGIKQANTQNWDGGLSVGIGSISGDVEIPLKKGKSGLLLGGRLSSTGLITEGLKAFGVQAADFITGFNDLVAKYHTRLSGREQLEVLGYYASDYMKYSQSVDGKFGVNNILIGTTYRRQGAGGWASSHKLSAARFSYQQNNEYKSKVFGLDFKPGDRLSYRYTVGNVTWEGIWRKRLTADVSLKTGGEFNLFRYSEPSISTTSAQPILQYPEQEGGAQLLYNPVAFASLEWTVAPKLTLVPGLRLSPFFYEENAEWKVLPRFSAQYSLHPQWALFAAYDRSAQAFHRFRNSVYSSSLDFPVLPSSSLPVQTTDQLALGGVFTRGGFEAQVQGFYRWLKNATDRNYYLGQTFYELGDGVLPPVRPRAQLLPVNGRTYGVETALGYKWGIFSWNAAYTWSRSFRQSPEVNLGREYNFEFNREHYFKTDFITRFKRNSLDKIVQLGASFTYGSGFYAQFPLQFYNAPPLPDDGSGRGRRISYIPERNNAALPNLHHLDVVINFIAQKKHGVRTFTISLFNAYFAPLVTSYTYDSASGKLQGREGIRVFPSISYSYKF